MGIAASGRSHKGCGLLANGKLVSMKEVPGIPASKAPAIFVGAASGRDSLSLTNTG